MFLKVRSLQLASVREEGTLFLGKREERRRTSGSLLFPRDVQMERNHFPVGIDVVECLREPVEVSGVAHGPNEVNLLDVVHFISAGEIDVMAHML